MEELKLQKTLEKKGLEKNFYTFGLSNDFLEHHIVFMSHKRNTWINETSLKWKNLCIPEDIAKKMKTHYRLGESSCSSSLWVPEETVSSISCLVRTQLSEAHPQGGGLGGGEQGAGVSYFSPCLPSYWTQFRPDWREGPGIHRFQSTQLTLSVTPPFATQLSPWNASAVL